MNIYYVIISTISLAFCIYTGLKGNIVVPSFCFLLSLAFLFVANLDKIKKASASARDGFTIEAQETIHRAEVTIQEMRELSTLVAQTSLSLVQRASRFGGYQEEEKEEIKKKALQVLSQMGVTNEEQDKILVEWHMYTELDYVLLILGNQVPSKWPEEERVKWQEMRKDLRASRPAPSEIKKLLEKNNALSDLHLEALEEYEYYIEHRKHRRPEFWRDYRNLQTKFNL